MSEPQSLTILKDAILLEKRGKAFYQKVADASDNPDVKRIFRAMAEEEANHLAVLSEQFKSFQKNQRFLPANTVPQSDSDLAGRILSQSLRQEIAAADFEAAAISAAISMEERAVKLYARQAEATEDPDEKALYEWLSQWERDHLNFLLDIDHHLTQKIWHDNGFWPF